MREDVLRTASRLILRILGMKDCLIRNSREWAASSHRNGFGNLETLNSFHEPLGRLSCEREGEWGWLVVRERGGEGGSL